MLSIQFYFFSPAARRGAQHYSICIPQLQLRVVRLTERTKGILERSKELQIVECFEGVTVASCSRYDV